jgi:hypothetical protein
MKSLNRRLFFKLSGLLISGVAFFKSGTNLVSQAYAAPKPISEANIKKLQYVEDATKITDAELKSLYEGFVAKHKAENANCSGCAFYKADAATPGQGKCTMAAMQYVAAIGFCKSYKFKA